ncbi:MAG: NADH-quinone oxidoreductase subunit H [Zestosphaera sp.]
MPHELLALAMALASVLLAPAYDGVERKIRAAIHSRIGPPVLQTWFDIIKLFSRESVIPEGGCWYVLISAMEFTSLLASTAVFTYLSTTGLYGAMGLETLAFLILLTTATSLAIVRAVVQNNVFSAVGGFREFSLTISAEPFLALSYLLLASGAGSTATRSLAFLLLALCCYVVSGRTPYDIAEAEPELAAGVNIELAGPLLGLTVFSTALKRYLAAGLTALVLVSLVGFKGLPSLTLTLTMIPPVWVAHAVAGTLFGRSRVDASVRTLYLILTCLTLVTLTAYGAGL